MRVKFNESNQEMGEGGKSKTAYLRIRDARNKVMQKSRNKATQTFNMVEDEWVKEYAELKAKSSIPTPDDSRNVSPIISIEQPGTKRVESKFIET